MSAEKAWINPDIQKDEPKVVHEVVASGMEKPMGVYCEFQFSRQFDAFIHFGTDSHLLLFYSPSFRPLLEKLNFSPLQW